MAAPKYITINGNKKQLKAATQTSAGIADADKIVATGPDGFIDASLIPGSEETIVVAGETLSTNDFVNIYDDGGTPKLRKADASAFATRAMGMVKDNYVADDDAKVYSEGIFGGFSGLTVGEPVFLSLTSGETTQTPPTGTNEIWQCVGEAYSATEIRLEIGEAILLS